MLEHLPKIEIVPHPRARSLKLRVQVCRIRLTVPPRCSQTQIDKFLAQSHQWMLETWQKLYTQQDNIPQQTLPTSLFVCGLGKLQVLSQAQHQLFVTDFASNTLFIKAAHEAAALQAFISAYAKDYLAQQLQCMSLSTGLSYTGFKCRKAKTRWGSCTRQHGIMLNSYLVLYPLEIVHYVMIHELAHTQHFNHSAQFWALVEKHCPNYKALQAQLKQQPLPNWLFRA